MNFNLKNILSLLTIILISTLTLPSCQEDFDCGSMEANFNDGCDDGDANTVDDIIQTDCTCAGTSTGQSNVEVLSQNITTDMTLTADKTWVLSGRISVESGATLTIEPGTVIKGQAGTDVNATSLLIARGATLIADGRADAPIIFTSIADEITPEQIASGDFGSPNLNPDVNGLWGGLLVLGNAVISASNDNGDDISEVQIEGIPTSDANGLYGGNDDADNSGIIRYVSIRHGGSEIGSGNEINGLTLGGVGSGTVVENIEVVANQDDGIEWFGGTVDVFNAVIWNAGDDAIDTDQSWSGTLDNFAVITPNNSCFELDGPEGTFVAGHTIMNGSVVAVASGRVINASLIDVDSNTPVNMTNVHFVGPLSVDGNFLSMTEDEVDNSTFENVTFEIDAVDLGNLMGQGGSIPAGISAGGSPQADVSVFDWTWASDAGALMGL